MQNKGQYDKIKGKYKELEKKNKNKKTNKKNKNKKKQTNKLRTEKVGKHYKIIGRFFFS